jgi:peptidoglycan hydrolase-like protein with peptidoglycan-binding domain
MRKSWISILVACLCIACNAPYAGAQQAELLPSTLVSLTHNCPNTGIMSPEKFDPLLDTYLLTVANWVTRVTLTPVSADPQAVILINGTQIKSGETSQFFVMSDEPQVVTISVTSTSMENSNYSIYLQRRLSNAQTGVTIGYLKDMFGEGGITYLVTQPVTAEYTDDNITALTNGPTLADYKYPVSIECTFMYNTAESAVHTKNADDFKAHVSLGGIEQYRIIIVENQIVAVMPFTSGLINTPEATPIQHYVTVTPAPGGGYVTLREGDKGDMISALQQALKDQGYFTGAVDGMFGAETTGAVAKYQLNHGLLQDSLAGRDTQSLLFEGKLPKVTTAPTAIPKATRITDFIRVTPSPSGAYVTLHEGDIGDLVTILQQALKDQRYYTGVIDKMYGAGTTDAVTDFQRDHGLAQDGIAGPAMQRVLYGAAPSGPIVTTDPSSKYATLQEGDIGVMVKSLQQALDDQNYFTGNIDTIYGAKTKYAVTNFQRNHGLLQDGIASPYMQYVLFERYFPNMMI